MEIDTLKGYVLMIFIYILYMYNFFVCVCADIGNAQLEVTLQCLSCL